jgi:hypothetical protein
MGQLGQMGSVGPVAGAFVPGWWDCIASNTTLTRFQRVGGRSMSIGRSGPVRSLRQYLVHWSAVFMGDGEWLAVVVVFGVL